MFKSILTRLGVGGAAIDARLDRDQLRIGERLTGVLHISGGDGSLTATRGELKLLTRVEHEEGEHVALIATTHVALVAGSQIPGPIRLEGEHRIPFALDLPPFTPVTAYGGRVFVWLQSSLDVPMAVDPKDRDPLQVYPAPEQQAVVDAMAQLGFRLVKTDVEARGGWKGRGFVQAFAFRPVTYGRLRYDEVEIVFEGLLAGHADLLVQVDRSARSLSASPADPSGTDERWQRISVDTASAETAASDLSRLLG